MNTIIEELRELGKIMLSDEERNHGLAMLLACMSGQTIEKESGEPISSFSRE